MKEPLDELLEWLHTFDELQFSCNHRNVIEKIWQIKSKKKIENEIKWNYFSENNFPLKDWDIVVFGNKKNKYYIEYTDSEFYKRCINRNYIKWIKL